MKKLKFVGFHHAHGDYYNGRGGAWKVDDVKELDDKDAEALLADFAALGKGTTPASPKPAFVKA